MTERSPANVLLALRARLVAAGKTVFLGKIVDPNQDSLPVVTIHYANEGDQSIRELPERIRELSLVIEQWTQTVTDDPALELIPIGEALRGTLIQHNDGNLDRLGGAADSIVHERTVLEAHREYTDVGVVQLVVRVTY
jgi:hypothetical protein